MAKNIFATTPGLEQQARRSQFTINGSSTFELHLERRGTNYFVHGVVRQDGRGSNAAACLVYGVTLAVSG